MTLEDRICPWCIADGSAAERFDAEFIDPAGIGSYGEWEEVPPDIRVEVSRRTPGFTGWQQERWWTHCGDAGEFLGPAGHEELIGLWSAAIPVLRAEVGYEGVAWDHYFQILSRDQGPTAYVFRCRQCGQLGGYSDCH